MRARGSPRGLRSLAAAGSRRPPQDRRARRACAARAPSWSYHSQAASLTERISRKSGHRFSEKDMRHLRNLGDVDHPVDVRPDPIAIDPVDMERDRGPHPGIAEPVDLVKPGMAKGAIPDVAMDRRQG